MSANLRFSTNTVDGKKYLGGPLITGANGIFSPSATSANLVFDEVLKSENIAGTADYRCLYLQNDFSNQTIYEPKIEIVSMTDTAVFTVGLLTDKNVNAEAIGAETTAPSGIVFSNIGLSTPVNLIKGSNNSLLPGEYVGFWIKRTPQNLGTSGTVTGELIFQLRYKT